MSMMYGGPCLTDAEPRSCRIWRRARRRERGALRSLWIEERVGRKCPDCDADKTCAECRIGYARTSGLLENGLVFPRRVLLVFFVQATPVVLEGSSFVLASIGQTIPLHSAEICNSLLSVSNSLSPALFNVASIEVKLSYDVMQEVS